MLGPVVKRLRHRPFTAVTRVRFPSGSPRQKPNFWVRFFLFLIPRSAGGRPFSPQPHSRFTRKQDLLLKLLVLWGIAAKKQPFRLFFLAYSGNTGLLPCFIKSREAKKEMLNDDLNGRQIRGDGRASSEATDSHPGHHEKRSRHRVPASFFFVVLRKEGNRRKRCWMTTWMVVRSTAMGERLENRIDFQLLLEKSSPTELLFLHRNVL